MTVSQVTLGGKDVTKGDFGDDAVASYLYVDGDVVYDIETSDEAIATAALAALPDAGASRCAGDVRRLLVRPSVGVARAGAVSELTRRSSRGRRRGAEPRSSARA